MKNDIFPSLGRKPVNEISPPILLIALRKVEARGALEVAQRIMQRCGSVFTYGIATGVCERNPAIDLSGALTLASWNIARRYFRKRKVEQRINDLA